MQQSNITFQNRKLTVDYITFNLQNGTSQIQEIDMMMMISWLLKVGTQSRPM